MTTMAPAGRAAAQGGPSAAGKAAGVQRVAVLQLDFAGRVPDAGQELFSQRLVDGLTAARFEVFGGAAVQRALADEALATCRDISCYPRVAGALQVGYLVSGRVSESNKTYAITLELINGATGAVVATSNERCETCGIEDAAEKMGLAASALRARLEAITRAPARLVIRSTPAAAEARIDGKPVGRTPVDLEVADGEHRLMLTRGGYHPLERTFTVVSGVDETLDIDLTPVPMTFPFRTAGWVSLAVGVVGLAVGGWALAVDGSELDCGPAERDPRGHCPYVRNTDVLGAVMVGVGAVGASMGGVFLYIGSRGDDPGSESTQARAVGLGWRGRF